VIVREVGEAEREKFPELGEVTIKVTVVEWMGLPLVPVIMTI